MKKLNMFSRLVAVTLLLGGSAVANAGWIQIADTILDDTATNPDSIGNQNPDTVAAWLQDLLDLSTPPTLLASGDSTPATLTGIPAGAQYLTLHYGNLAGVEFQNVTVAYSCSSDCGTFTGYSTNGLSDYRIYGTATGVPEPGTLGLLGAGLLALGLSRRRMMRMFHPV